VCAYVYMCVRVHACQCVHTCAHVFRRGRVRRGDGACINTSRLCRNASVCVCV